MSSLLPEAKQIITFIGLWIAESFDERSDELEALAANHQSSADRSSARDEHQASSPRLPLSIAPPAPLAAQHDRVDDAEDDDDDEPLSFTPRSMRSPSNTMADLPPSNLPQMTSPSSPRGQPPKGTASGEPKLRPPSIATLARNHRPSSFSGTDTTQRPKQVTDLAANEVEGENSSSGRRRLSDTSSSLVAARRAAREAAGTALGARRFSREPTNGSGPGNGYPSSAMMDEKYQAMLVKESSLLQRRREDALASMTQGDTAVPNSAVLSSDEDSEEEE